MKRYTLLVSALFVLGSVVVPFLGPMVAHAEPIPASPTATGAQKAALTASTGGVAASTPTPQGAGSDDSSAFNKVIMLIMSLFAWFLGIAAIILEYAVYYTVVKMGDYIHGLSAVSTVWRILRDIGNIVLIFGFVAMGIETIINTNFYGNVSKRLPTLLIVAVLLNFSLFFTEAIIDAGNLFATQFYSNINGGSVPVPQSLFNNGTIANEGISNAILAKLNLTQLYGDAIQNKNTYSGQLYIGVFGCLLFIIASFVMLSLAFILISRFITLIFLIVVAPIGFAGLIVPKLENTARDWWKMLINQTLTAPVLLLMLYVALSVILDPKFLNGFSNGTAAPTGGLTGFVTGSTAGLPGLGSMLLSFIVAMGLLLGVTVLAKKMSAVGAGAATKWAGALSFGAVAFGARNTAGRLATRGAQRWQKSGYARVPVVGRAVSGALNKGAAASFDIRGVKSMKNLPGGGLQAGDAQKGGFKKSEEEAVKARVKYASSLENTATEKEELGELGDNKQGTIVDARKDVDSTKKAHADALQKLNLAHQAASATFSSKITAAEQENTAAEEAYVVDASDANKMKLDAARVSVADARAAQVIELDRQRQVEEKLAKEQKKVREEGVEKLAELEKRKKELTDAPQKEYAESLTWVPVLRGGANKAAKEKILKELKKDKSEKDREKLLAALEKAATADEKKEEKKSE